jgi:diamine N-acetyltransferase
MLITNNTLLRMPLDRDRDSLTLMRNDIDLQGILMSRVKPNTLKKVDNWLNKRLADEHGVFFIIADVESNNCVGFVQLINIDFISRRGDLGICLDKQYQGKGYASNALLLLENYTKKVFNIRKFLLQVLGDNYRAINFYKKNGYCEVGILREHFYMNNEFNDVILMEKIYK